MGKEVEAGLEHIKLSSSSFGSQNSLERLTVQQVCKSSGESPFSFVLGGRSLVREKEINDQSV